jgi:hypothetical protein
MSRQTSSDEPYPNTGYENQPSGTVPMEDLQTARVGTSNSGRTITPRASSFFPEGRSSQQFTSDVIHGGSNTGVPDNEDTIVRSNTVLESPRTRGWGDALILVPPSRPTSRSGSARVERDPHVAQLPPSRSNSLSLGSQADLLDRPRSETRGITQVSPPTLSPESSITPTIHFERLIGVIPEEQVMELRRLVSNHSLQRRQLVSAGSYLQSLLRQSRVVQADAERLTNRVDQFLTTTVQFVADGDDYLSTISRRFDNAFANPIDRRDDGRSTAVRSSITQDNTSDIRVQPIDVNLRSSERPSSHPLVDNNEQGTGPVPINDNTQSERPNATTDPSPQMVEAMNREFAPRRIGETDIQYDNRYSAHLRSIHNTQQSWMGQGYDIPPRTSQDIEEVPANNITEEIRMDSTRVRPPPPGRTHPSAPGNVRYRDEMITNIRAINANTRDPRVQFDSASRPYQYDPEPEIRPEENYPMGPTGTSAYRVTHGPPTNGLWNAEQYHYTVLIKRIRQLVHWKVGSYISAPVGSKQPKMGEPTKYSGNRNHDVFLQWLNQFLNWLRSHYHCGDEADYSRLNFLGNYLEGTAADWFAADVDNPDRMSVEPMKFIDAICSMHRRFVRTATANNAVTQYDKVEYSNSDGVEGFYYKLDKMASRMVERPNDYSFRLRLFEGLPAWMYDTLLERNILPEFCSLEDIRENARQIEELRMRARGPSKSSNITANMPRAPSKAPAKRDIPNSSQGTNRAPNRMNRNNNQPNVERNVG